jgi:proline iminopeptidase
MKKFILSFLSVILLIACNPQKSLDLLSGHMNFNEGKIYYEIHGSHNTNSDPIFIIHGGPAMDHTYLTPQLFELAKHHTVIFYDQRGAGKSTDTVYDKEHISNASYLRDLEALRKHLGYNKITVFGHSYGGHLAMQYAFTYPSHVSHLILANSSGVDLAGVNKFLEETQRRAKPIQDKLDKIINSPAYKAHSLPETHEYLDLIFSLFFYDKSKFKELTPDTLAGYWDTAPLMADFWTTPFDFRADLQKLNIPTLIIHGKEDVVPLSVAEDIHKAIPGSKLVIIEDSDHFPYIEKPSEFFEAIEKFLK